MQTIVPLMKFALTAGLTLVIASTAAGAEPLDGDGVIVIDISEGMGADAMVTSVNPTTNHGDSPVLAIKSIDYSIKKTYLRFDLTRVPEDAQIEAAQLVFTTNNNHAKEQTIEVFGLMDGHDGEKWAEGLGGETNSLEEGINYENAPANALKVGGGENAQSEFSGGVLASDVLHLGSFEVLRKMGIAGVTYIFSTTELIDFLNADSKGGVTMILTAIDRQNSQDVGFSSKEDTNRPAPELRLKWKNP